MAAKHNRKYGTSLNPKNIKYADCLQNFSPPAKIIAEKRQHIYAEYAVFSKESRSKEHVNCGYYQHIADKPAHKTFAPFSDGNFRKQ